MTIRVCQEIKDNEKIELLCAFGGLVLDNITDYIYNSDQLGMAMDVKVEEIIERVLADKK